MSGAEVVPTKVIGRAEGADRVPAHRPRVFPLEWWMPCAVFFGALAVRLVNVGAVNEYWDDSSLHAINDVLYARFGLLGPDGWFYPPLKHVLMYLAVRVFGNDLIGWHMREILFGALSAVVVFLIARRVFGRPFPAVAAAVLVALDPLAIAMSHQTAEEVTTTCLMLLGILFLVRVLQDERWVDKVLAGVCIGLATATDWWGYAPALVMLAIVTIGRRARPRDVTGNLAYLVVIPVIVYVLAYIPWFAAGNTVPDLARLQADAVSQQGGSGGSLFSTAEVEALGSPVRWFFTWAGAGTRTEPVSGNTRYSVMMSDPVLWILYLPAVAYLSWRSFERHRRAGLLLGGTFILLYGFFLVSPRTLLLYVICSVVPVGFLAVAYAAERLLGRGAWWFLGLAAAWSLYLYPIVVGVPVAAAAYGWILRPLGL